MNKNKHSNRKDQIDSPHDFMKLYMAVQPRLYGFIMSMIHKWNDAEDVMQETLSVMWRKFDQFEDGTDFAAWGLAIARYQVMSYYQRQKNLKLRFSDQTIDLLVEQATAKEERDNAFIDALKECVSRLPEKDRSLLELRYEIGSGVKDIAVRFNRGINAIYKSLGRVHNMLLICVRSKV